MINEEFEVIKSEFLRLEQQLNNFIDVTHKWRMWIQKRLDKLEE